MCSSEGAETERRQHDHTPIFKNALILTHYTDLFTNRNLKKKENYKEVQLIFIFLEAFRDPFVTAAEVASESSSSTRANLHSQSPQSHVHRPTSVPTSHPSIPPPENRAKDQVFTKDDPRD
jgi:hypothetical protein